MPSTQKMNSAESALHDGHKQGALEHGAGDDGEFGEDLALLVGGERDRIFDAPGQRRPVAQKEEQQIEHDEQANDEVRRALADAKRLRGDGLAALDQGGRQARLYCAQIGQTEAIQDVGCPGRQGVDDLLNELTEIHLARLDRLVQICCFLQQRRGRQRQWQDHHGQDDQHARDGG